MQLQVPSAQEVATDLEVMKRSLPMAGARVLELGCGRALMTRQMVEELGAAHVIATEVDRVQHDKNVEIQDLPAVSFKLAGAEDTGEPDASFDLVVMLKSFHHVPADRMDTALDEIRRVLRPGGLAYISEPVYAGAFNDILRLFNDERVVREEAFKAIERAVQRGAFELVDELFFQAPSQFADWTDFKERILNVTHTEHRIDPGLYARIRDAFMTHLSPEGALFFNPIRVDLLHRP
jgi:ubiquinone/menaquinone biosynthesis C-methylase UbiE